MNDFTVRQHLANDLPIEDAQAKKDFACASGFDARVTIFRRGRLSSQTELDWSGWVSISTLVQAENSSQTAEARCFQAMRTQRDKLGLTTEGTQTNNLRLFPTFLSCKPASHSSAKVPADA